MYCWVEKLNNIADNLRNIAEKMTQLSDFEPNKLRFKSFCFKSDIFVRWTSQNRDFTVNHKDPRRSGKSKTENFWWSELQSEPEKTWSIEAFYNCVKSHFRNKELEEN